MAALRPCWRPGAPSQLNSGARSVRVRVAASPQGAVFQSLADRRWPVQPGTSTQRPRGSPWPISVTGSPSASGFRVGGDGAQGLDQAAFDLGRQIARRNDPSLGAEHEVTPCSTKPAHRVPRRERAAPASASTCTLLLKGVTSPRFMPPTTYDRRECVAQRAGAIEGDVVQPRAGQALEQHQRQMVVGADTGRAVAGLAGFALASAIRSASVRSLAGDHAEGAGGLPRGSRGR